MCRAEKPRYFAPFVSQSSLQHEVKRYEDLSQIIFSQGFIAFELPVSSSRVHSSGVCVIHREMI